MTGSDYKGATRQIAGRWIFSGEKRNWLKETLRHNDGWFLQEESYYWEMGSGSTRQIYVSTCKDFRLPLTLKDLSRKRNGFLVLFFVFSLGYHVFSGVSLIKYSGRTTDIKKAPLDFSEERKFFFCTFEQERRFKLTKKEKFTFLQKQFRWPIKKEKFHLCSKRQ